MKRDGVGVRFESTGRWISANCGIIGLGPGPSKDGRWNVNEGYDGIFEPCWDHEKDEKAPPLTREELMELSDFMVFEWVRFRAWVETGKTFEPEYGVEADDGGQAG